MTKKLFTSDWHLGHHNILQYCNRPFVTTVGMKNAFLDTLGDMYEPGDILYYIGDLTLHGRVKVIYYLDELYAIGIRNIHFIFGNHDYRSRMHIEEHKVIVWSGDIAFVDVKGQSQKAVLCHYPMRTWRSSGRGAWMLHGHCHGNLLSDPIKNSIDVGIDSAYQMLGEYRPFTEFDLRKYIK